MWRAVADAPVTATQPGNGETCSWVDNFLKTMEHTNREEEEKEYLEPYELDIKRRTGIRKMNMTALNLKEKKKERTRGRSEGKISKPK